MWWWHTFGLLLIASLLFAKGLRGKRVGDQLHCRKCNYQLTGITSSKCPECGHLLETGDILVGLKKIQWRWILLACFVPLFWQPTIDLYRHWEGIQTEQWISVNSLLQQAKVGDLVAIDELDRRINYDPPTEQDIKKIAAFALALHGDSPLDEAGIHRIKIIDSLDYRDYLSQADKDTVFPRYANATITSREHVRIGDPLPIKISFNNYRYGMAQYKYWLELQEVSVDKSILLEDSKSDWRNRRYDWFHAYSKFLHDKYTYVPTANAPLGTQHVIYYGTHILNHHQNDIQIDNPSWTNDFQLETMVDFLPEDSEDLVSWIDRPELLSFIKWSINVRVMKPNEWRGRLKKVIDDIQDDDESTYISFECNLHQSIPVPIAFEFLVESGSDTYPATLTAGTPFFYTGRDDNLFAFKSGTTYGSSYMLKVPKLQTNEFHIILRGSKDVARKTIDMYQVWKGELRYGPFVLQPDHQDNG